MTVNPRTKTIIDDKNIEAYLQSDASPLQASAIVAFSKLSDFFVSFVASFSNFAVDHGLALASQEKVVIIAPGARKEEVATALARTLTWNGEEKKEFLNADEGFLFPGMYVVDTNASPLEVKTAIEERFNENILSRYGTTTEEIVPLTTALTIASLIQKETIGTRDMRLVSGIIWNRIFVGQKLQLDATLQYVKASKLQNGQWWPKVLSKDKFIESPYNTYKHHGLPPTPIASPSVAAVVAALNPLRTDCFYYFHDKDGDIHCSVDYETHEALIEQFFNITK
ncbi:MAG: endolytic transglycosylase MltG [Patescibacteria group bacterium]